MSITAIQFVSRLSIIALFTFILVRVIFILHADEKATHSLKGTTAASSSTAADPAKFQPSLLNLERQSKLSNRTAARLAKKRQGKPLYEWDNKVVRASMRWGDFVKLSPETNRNKGNIPSSVLSSLKQCSSSSIANQTSKICVNVSSQRFCILGNASNDSFDNI